ncbi:MAG: hypothetical protein AMXMBFR64_25790 [Myxococcales bacterium]
MGSDQAAELDRARVDHVRASIRAGTYRVDATGLADRILLEALITVVHDRLATAPAAAHAAPG